MSHEDLDKLLAKKAAMICRYLLKLGVSKNDAEDIVQDTIYKALLIIHELEIERLDPWLLRVAINGHKDMLRKRKIREEIPEDSLDLIGGKALDDIIITKELQNDIRSIFEGLSSTQKHILLLKYEYDLSYKQISSLLDMKIETVKVALYRARNQFKEMYRRVEDAKR